MKKIFLITILIAGLNYAQNSFWEYHDNMDKPVGAGAIISDGSNIFIFGGYSDSLQATVNWVQKFGNNYSNWELDTMDFPRKGLVAKNYQNLTFLFGGIFDETLSISGLETWNELNTDENTLMFNKNFNRNYSTGHIVGDNFYIIGGNSLQGTSLDTLPYIVEYNLIASNVTYQTDTLFNSSELPEQQMSEVIGNDIFIFGGVINGISQSIYKFDIVTHSYEKLAIELLEPRAGGEAVFSSTENKIYIIGGFNESNQALSSVEVFSFSGNEYFIESAAPIQEPRYNFMAAELNNTLFIFGGFDADGNVVKSVEQLSASITTVKKDDNFDRLPSKIELQQNYPNPFNPVTTISYNLISRTEDNSLVELNVFDGLGRIVKTLVNEVQPNGNYTVNFNADQLTSGIYFYQLKTNSIIQTKKMILLK